MNHRSYDAQRFSPLTRINRDNVKNLKFAYAVPLGGGANGREFVEATPLAEDGFLYITDSWGVLYKIDATRGRCRPHRVADGSASSGRAGQPRRRVVGQLCDLTAEFPGPHHRDRQEHRQGRHGRPTCRTPSASPSPARRSPSRTRSSSAPRAATAGRATGSAALDAATGKLLWRKYTIPAPGEPGSETWKDKNNAWQTGGGAVWVTGSYDPATNQTLWGTGNPVPMMDARAPSGRQSLYQQRDLVRPRQRQDELVFPVYARRHVGFRRGRQPHFGRRHGRRPAAQDSSPIRRATASSTRWSATTAPWSAPSPTWTCQLDQGHRPEDRQADRLRSRQGHADLFGRRRPDLGGDPIKRVCPTRVGGNNYWPSAYSRRTKLSTSRRITGAAPT